MYARIEDHPPTIGEVLGLVAAHYGVGALSLTDHQRHRSTVVRARQVAHYLCAELTGRSLPEIGRVVDRDHSTIYHSRKRVAEQILTDSELRDEIDALRTALLRRLEKNLVDFVSRISGYPTVILTSAIGVEILQSGGDWPGELFADELPDRALAVISLHGVVASGRTTAAACEAWLTAARRAVESLTTTTIAEEHP